MMRSFLSCLLICLFLQSASADHAHFKITEKTLATLASQNLKANQIQALQPLLSKLFKSEVQFIEALKKIQPPILASQDVQMILEHAKIKNLIASAQKLSGNLKEGKLVFSQGVEGWIPKESLEFFADKMSLLSHDKKSYQLLIAEYHVILRQNDRYLYANRITYDRAKRKIELRGQVKIEDSHYRILAEQADVDMENKRITLWGQQKDRVLIQINHHIAKELLETPMRNYQELPENPYLSESKNVLILMKWHKH